jgi:uncharacterized protein YecE (DUF72 family)
MLYVGTSGYSYDDWEGPFYPAGLRKGDRLPFYAKHFGATEVNSTFYRILPPSAMAGMARKVPGQFRFAVKANRMITHDIGPQTGKALEDFRASLEPLLQTGKLGCVLAQFPYSFHNTAASRRHLTEIADRMSDLPTVVEFRNREWLAEPVLEFLRERRLGFACVDQPQLEGLIPPLVVATSDIGYVRFHGRNAAKWWQHEQAYERYDYLYTEAQLREWLPKVQELAAKTRETYLFFNNHYMAQAVVNAQQLLGLLQQ